MKTVSREQVAMSERVGEFALPPRVQEALGQLVGSARWFRRAGDREHPRPRRPVGNAGRRRDPELRGTLLALRSVARRVQQLTIEERQLRRDIETLTQKLAPQLLDRPGVRPLATAQLLLSWSLRLRRRCVGRDRYSKHERANRRANQRSHHFPPKFVNSVRVDPNL